MKFFRQSAHPGEARTGHRARRSESAGETSLSRRSSATFRSMPTPRGRDHGLGERSLAQHLAGSRSGRASSRVRRTRAAVAGLLAVVVIGVALGLYLGTPASNHKTAAPTVGSPHHSKPASIPAAESGLLPWHLAAPISRTVVLPAGGNQLVVLGGLTTGNTSSSGIDFATGVGDNADSVAGAQFVDRLAVAREIAAPGSREKLRRIDGHAVAI